MVSYVTILPRHCPMTGRYRKHCMCMYSRHKRQYTTHIHVSNPSHRPGLHIGVGTRGYSPKFSWIVIQIARYSICSFKLCPPFKKSFQCHCYSMQKTEEEKTGLGDFVTQANQCLPRIAMYTKEGAEELEIFSCSVYPSAGVLDITSLRWRTHSFGWDTSPLPSLHQDGH